MTKKAQAAMEFLITYGWAILVVLAAIAALAHFGVLAPSKFLPEKCTLPAGIYCADFNLGAEKTTIVLLNSMGRDLILNSVSIGSCINLIDKPFLNGDQKTLLLNCNFPKGKLKEKITIEFIDQTSSITKSMEGDIQGEVKG